MPAHTLATPFRNQNIVEVTSRNLQSGGVGSARTERVRAGVQVQHREGAPPTAFAVSRLTTNGTHRNDVE
jgi:hypothetical protein